MIRRPRLSHALRAPTPKIRTQPRKRIVFIAALLALTTSPATAQMSLKQAVLSAVERDANVTALRTQVASRSIDIQSARDGYYPNISLSGDSSTTSTDGPGITLTVTQVLYDWGLIRNTISAASQVRVQAVSDLKMAVEDMTLQVAEYYLDTEAIDEKIRSTRTYYAFTQRIAKQAQDRASAGLSDIGEVARAQLEIARANDQLAQLVANRSIALSQIGFLTGTEVTQLAPPPALNFDRHYANPAKIRSAVRIAPDYIAARASTAEAAAQIDIARASRYPTINLQAQARADLNGGATKTALGLSAGVDLSSSGLGKRKIQSAQLNLQAAEATLVSTERQLTNTATSALQQLQILRTSETSRRAQLNEAANVLDAYEKQFIGGQRELLDLLTTGRDLYDAEIDQIETSEERKRTEYTAARDLGVLGTLIFTSSN
ncbi:TolC family protein [Albirhodobacter sp. R86504]|uniref:TolC family protein n=1 Tax=Albirhodobacter sp. R86504 TaxID=3093848 RepID=UPI003671CAE6